MTNYYLLEDSSGGYLDEDNSVLLLDSVLDPSTLQDNFNDNSLNSTLWRIAQLYDPTLLSTGVTVVETSSEIQISAPAGVAQTRINGLLTVNSYDMTNNSFFVRFVSPTLTSDYTIFIGMWTPNGKYGYGVEWDTWQANPRSATSFSVVEGIKSRAWSFTHNAGDFIQLSIDGSGNFVGKTAPSTANPPTSTDWTTKFTQVPDPKIPKSGLLLGFGGGAVASAASSPLLEWDGFNTAV